MRGWETCHHIIRVGAGIIRHPDRTSMRVSFVGFPSLPASDTGRLPWTGAELRGRPEEVQSELEADILRRGVRSFRGIGDGLGQHAVERICVAV